MSIRSASTTGDLAEAAAALGLLPVHSFASLLPRALDALTPNASCPAWPRLQNAAEMRPGNSSGTYLELERA
jgi:uncharacterized protein YidB (DUF937 family)